MERRFGLQKLVVGRENDETRVSPLGAMSTTNSPTTTTAATSTTTSGETN
ncbi:hypothetical protein Syun_026130 [Stephania yunnanensis]|uniref:Uncharacterized protein n=1 Tax=Stephania yunnanensis TaxID=152371 RepID=A0AAP0ESZ3_9MAGN